MSGRFVEPAVFAVVEFLQRIRPVIAKTYTLDDAGQAYVDFVGARPVGKLVVTMPA